MGNEEVRRKLRKMVEKVRRKTVGKVGSEKAEGSEEEAEGKELRK